MGFLEQLLGRLQGQEGSCHPFPGSPGKSPSWHPLCLAFPAKPRVGRETHNETNSNSHFMTSFPPAGVRTMFGGLGTQGDQEFYFKCDTCQD